MNENISDAIDWLNEIITNPNGWRMFYSESETKSCAEVAFDFLKDQILLKQKIWDALYAEEDELEKKYAGTNENDNWFLIYRPWLQRGFEIALETIVKQED